MSLDDLERVYRSEYGRFRRVAFALLRDEEDAREAVQEAFARALRARRSFRHEGELGAWLWRTVTNVCLDARRRTAGRNGGRPAAESPREGAAVDDAVRRAIAQLPERQKLVLFLRHYADLRYEQIGEVLGIARGTVAATLHAARASLRESMEEVTR